MSDVDKSSTAGWSYEVVIDPSFTNGNFGHAILQINSPTGYKVATGFYPRGGADSTNLPDFTGAHHAVESRGHVRDENEEVNYPEYSFHSRPRNISEETARKMIDYIAERVENPQRYELWDHNCVEFVEGAMKIAGDESLVSNSKVPALLKQKIEIQEASEDIIKNTKKEICIDNKEDWDIVTQLYNSMKKTICDADAEPNATAAGVDRLTKTFAKELDDLGLHKLAEKIKANELQTQQEDAASRSQQEAAIPELSR